MTRLPLVALAMALTFGCTPEAPPAAVPDGPKPLLTPEPPAGVKPQPRDATVFVSPYTYPNSYGGPAGGGPLDSQPIPVLPTRKPARVFGDLRFMTRRGGGVLAVSPDGKLLATSSLLLFDAATGRELAAFHGHDRAVLKMAFSPDSSRLYSGETGGPPSTLIVWDIAAKQEVIRFPAADWSLTPDGKTLVTLERVADNRPGDMRARSRPVVRVRDTASWNELAGYAVNDFHPAAVAASPDGNTLALGGTDGTVCTWDRKAGKELVRLTDLTDAPAGVKPEYYKPAVTRLAFDPAGKRLAGANGGVFLSSGIRQVAAWDWPAGTPAGRWTMGGHDLTTFFFSPDGKHLLASDGLRTAVWNLATGKATVELSRDTHKRMFVPTAFAPGGDRLYVAGYGPRPELVAFPSLAPLPIITPPPDDGPSKVPFELTGPIPPAPQREKEIPSFRRSDGTTLRGGPAFEGGVQLLDKAGTVVRHFEKGRGVVFDVTPDGKLMTTYGQDFGGQDRDRPLRLWEVATGKEVAAIRVYPQPEYLLHFSPDGQRLAVRHSDGLVRIWDVATRRPLLALDPDGYWPTRLTFSKDGKSLVAGDDQSPILVVWDVTDPGR